MRLSFCAAPEHPSAKSPERFAIDAWIVAMFSKIAEAAGIPIIASGGVATIGDLRSLKALFAKRVVGAITGRALYEGRFTLREATSTLASS